MAGKLLLWPCLYNEAVATRGSLIGLLSTNQMLCLQLVAACPQTHLQCSACQACLVCSTVPAALCLPHQSWDSYAQVSGQTAPMHLAPCSFRGLGGGCRRRSSSGGDLDRAGSAAQPVAVLRSHSRSSSTGSVEVQPLGAFGDGAAAPEGSVAPAADEETPQVQAGTPAGGQGSRRPPVAGCAVKTPGWF